MSALSLYEWAIGSESDFLAKFQEDEELYEIALAFWENLDGISFWFPIFFAVIGLLAAGYYYRIFTNRARKYKRYQLKWWFLFDGIAMVLTFVATLALPYLLSIELPDLDLVTSLLLTLGFCNSIYSILFYFIVSIIWCNFLPTNACRFLAKGKK